MASSSCLRAGAATLLVCGTCAQPEPAPAAVVLILTQTPASVQVTGSGTLNTVALSLFQGATGGQASINPSNAFLTGGVTGIYVPYQGISGPASFASLGAPELLTAASSAAGSSLGIVGRTGFLYVPSGYVSGTPLTTNSTYDGATFASLGFVPGTYTYTWGSGANADSLTITSVAPEPSTWALALGGAGLLGMVARQRRGRKG